jgi:hypothetical protein
VWTTSTFGNVRDRIVDDATGKVVLVNDLGTPPLGVVAAPFRAMVQRRSGRHPFAGAAPSRPERAGEAAAAYGFSEKGG